MSPQPRLLTLGGVAAWLAVGVPILIAGADTFWRLALWLVAYAAFGVAFAASGRASLTFARRRFLVATEGAAVVVMVLLLCNGFEGTLLVLAAAQLGLSERRSHALPWIVVQSALLFAAIAIHWSLRPAIMLTPPYLGFQLFAFFVFDLLRREQATNETLRALQARLAETSRMEERLRIAQELHDAVGHHLTAMALHLEVVAHQTSGEAKENVRTAQSLARLVLSDVREIVAATAQSAPFDLRATLQELAAIPAPAVHLHLPEGLEKIDPDRAHAIVRCAQEIVTNAIRHATAKNLWLAIEWRGDAMILHARDDGRGASTLLAGSGLSGMRRRVADLGGTMHVATSDGAGFEVTARLPLAEAS